MVEQVFAEPYTPNPVPTGQVEGLIGVSEVTLGGVLKQVLDLQRFLTEELERIQTAMLFVPVQAAYGALGVVGAAADQPLTDVPELITGWNVDAPFNPNRVLIDFTTDNSLTTTEAGVYMVQLQITASIDTGSAYVFTIFRDGVATPIFTAVDASQQTDIVTIVVMSVITLNQGSVVQLFGEAQTQGQPHTFVMLSAVMTIFRISELHRDRSALP